jgi:hypothetical protein
MEITIIYDNVVWESPLTPDWGFACLVETTGQTLLFDTGAKGDILLGNMELIGIDPFAIDAVMTTNGYPIYQGKRSGVGLPVTVMFKDRRILFEIGILSAAIFYDLRMAPISKNKNYCENYALPNAAQKDRLRKRPVKTGLGNGSPGESAALRQMASRWLPPSHGAHPFQIHTDTTDFFRVEYGDVVVLG